VRVAKSHPYWEHWSQHGRSARTEPTARPGAAPGSARKRGRGRDPQGLGGRCPPSAPSRPRAQAPRQLPRPGPAPRCPGSPPGPGSRPGPHLGADHVELAVLLQLELDGLLPEGLAQRHHHHRGGGSARRLERETEGGPAAAAAATRTTTDGAAAYSSRRPAHAPARPASPGAARWSLRAGPGGRQKRGAAGGMLSASVSSCTREEGPALRHLPSSPPRPGAVVPVTLRGPGLGNGAGGPTGEKGGKRPQPLRVCWPEVGSSEGRAESRSGAARSRRCSHGEPGSVGARGAAEQRPALAPSTAEGRGPLVYTQISINS